MKCPECKKDCWDNRDKNKERANEGKKNLPEYACKDKDGCGWIQWPKKDDSKGYTKKTSSASAGSDGVLIVLSSIDAKLTLICEKIGAKIKTKAEEVMGGEIVDEQPMDDPNWG